MGYKEELDALGRWLFKTTGLRSHRLSSAPPQVARPVVLWEGPGRQKGRDLGSYSFIRTVSQYGKLYVNNLDQLADIIDKLEKDLADRSDLLPVFENDQAGAKQIGWLKQVVIEVTTSTVVDVPITVRYEVVQGRITPEEAPAATKVVTRMNEGAVIIE